MTGGFLGDALRKGLNPLPFIPLSLGEDVTALAFPNYFDGWGFMQPGLTQALYSPLLGRGL